MKKTICLLVILISGMSTVSAGLLEDYTGLSLDIVMDNKKYNKCFNSTAKEVPENFSDFLDQFTCRKTKDPIEHCLCLDRIIKELTPEDKVNLDTTLKRSIMYDPESDAHMGLESNNFMLLSGIYKEINTSPTVAPLKTCEESIKELEKSDCSNTSSRFKNILTVQSKIITNKAPLNRTPKEEQMKLMHFLYKTVIKKNLDIDNISSIKELYELAREEGDIPELSRLSSNFERYFISAGDPANDQLKKTRVVRLFKTLKENRKSIELLGEALNAEIRSYTGEMSVDMAADQGLEIFKNTLSVYAESEMKFYCENYFKKNALYYCQKEKKRYNEVMNSLDLNVDKYAEILKISTDKNIGNKKSVALIGLEGLYCSKLSDKIKENKKDIFEKELPKDCDSSICKLIKQRMQSGVALDKIQEELGLISKMPKTHEIKITKDFKENETSSPPLGPVSSSDKDMSRKSTAINVEDIFASKLGLNKDKVSTAFIEVKKSHPDLTLDIGQKPQALHSQELVAKEGVVHPEIKGPQMQPSAQNFQESAIHSVRPQYEIQGTQTFAEKSQVNSFTQPRANSTINMYPSEIEKFKMPELKPAEVKSRPAPKISSGATEVVSEDLAKLKEEYSKLKSEMTANENSESPEAVVEHKSETSTYAPKTVEAIRPETRSARAQAQNTFTPKMDMSLPTTSSGAPASTLQSGTDRAASPKISARPSGSRPQDNRPSGLVLTNQSVYNLSADEFELIKKDPKLLHSKYKNGILEPEIFTVSDASGEIKYLKAVYELNDKNEKSFVEFKEVEKSELCKANIIHGNCEVPMALAKTSEKKGKTSRRNQMYKVKELEKIIEKSTHAPTVSEGRGDKS